MPELPLEMLDVNVLIALLAEGHSHSDSAKAWYRAAQARRAILLVPEEAVAGFVRITTQPRFASVAQVPADVLLAVSSFLAREHIELALPLPSRTERALIFVSKLGLFDNDVPDAFLAAFAIERGARLVTFDHGFSRFPGLSVELLQR